MDKRIKAPKLRFEGFGDSWKESSIRELINFYEDKTTKEDEYPVLSSTMSGIFLQKDYFNNEVTTRSNVGYKIVPKGYITYISMSDTDIFHFNVQDLIDKGIVSPAYPVFETIRGNVANFLTTYMNENGGFKRQIAINKEGGTRYALSGKKLASLSAIIPQSPEQENIADFFCVFDGIISNLQKKLNRTKEFKVACLQSFFPKKGEVIPAVRFSGFSGEWKKCKLEEFGTVQTCKRIFKEQTTPKGEVPFFKNGTIGLEPDAFISRKIFEEYRELYPYPEIGDTLISVVGSIGRTAEYVGKEEYFQDSNVVWLKTNGSINKKFLKLSYQVIEWFIEGSTVKHLYNDNILKSEIVVPESQKEQKMIADYFEELERMITAYEQELELTKKMKKGCLQKMFV